MKSGEVVNVQSMVYRVASARGRQVVLRRLTPTRAHVLKLLKARRWRRLVSATFLVDSKTEQTVSNYELLALGFSVERIERLHKTLPLVSQS